MISSITPFRSGLESRITSLRRPAAFFRALRGVETITAPVEPPRTIRAAVNWATSLILPPSIRRPPTMPPKARRRPATVARSGRERPELGERTPSVTSSSRDRGRFCRVRGFEHRIGGLPGQFRQTTLREGCDLPPEGYHLPDNLIGRFDHYEFMAVYKADSGIGRDFDVLDQI